MSMAARWQRGGAGGRRHDRDKDGGAIDGEASDSVDKAERGHFFPAASTTDWPPTMDRTH